MKTMSIFCKYRSCFSIVIEFLYMLNKTGVHICIWLVIYVACINYVMMVYITYRCTGVPRWWFFLKFNTMLIKFDNHWWLCVNTTQICKQFNSGYCFTDVYYDYKVLYFMYTYFIEFYIRFCMSHYCFLLS